MKQGRYFAVVWVEAAVRGGETTSYYVGRTGDLTTNKEEAIFLTEGSRNIAVDLVVEHGRPQGRVVGHELHTMAEPLLRAA